MILVSQICILNSEHKRLEAYMKAIKYFYAFALTVMIIIYLLIPIKRDNIEEFSEKENMQRLSKTEAVTKNRGPSEPPAMEDDSPKEYFQRVINNYNEGGKLIEKNDFQLAAFKHMQAEEIYKKTSLYNLNLNGRKASDIYKETRENLLIEIKNKKEELFTAYKNLEFNYSAMNSLKSIRNDLFKEVTDTFYNKRRDFQQIRLSNAPDVLLLKFSKHEKYYGCHVYEYFKDNLFKNIPVKVGVGPAETTKERELAWKVVEVQITELQKNYNQIVQNYRGKQTSYSTSGYKLPAGVKVRFLPISGKVPTNWEKALNFSVSLDTPDSIKLETGNTNQMARLTLQFREELTEKLMKELVKIPPLRVLPKVDLNGDVLEHGKLNKELLNALRFNNPEKFKITLDKIKRSDSVAIRGELSCFIAENLIGSEASWLANEMYRQNDNIRFKVFDLISQLKSFGNYEVGLALAASVDDTGKISRFLVDLKKFNEKTENRLYKLIIENKAVKPENRKKLASILLHSMESSRNRIVNIEQFKSLAEDKDTDIAVRYLEACVKLNPDLHKLYFGKVYEKADEKQRSNLIRGLKFNPPFNEGSFKVLKYLVAKEESADLLKLIVYKATSIAKSPEGWQLLKELSKDKKINSNQDRLYRLEKAMVYSSAEALKDKAIPYLKSIISKGAHLSYALNELEDVQGKDFFKSLSEIIPKMSQKNQIKLLSYIASYATRKSTNYASPSFFSFVETAAKNKQPEICQLGFSLMGTSTKREWKDYNLELKRALEKESDDGVKKSLNSIISGL